MRLGDTKHARDVAGRCARPWRRGAGFTLVELMITVFVAAILIAIAVPSFQHITASSRLTSTANSIVGALHSARMEAIKRNADTQFCGNTGNGDDTLGQACATQTAAVYALTGASDAATATTVLAPLTINVGGQQLSGNVTPLQYGANGLAHKLNTTTPFTGEVADITNPDAGSKSHRRVCMIAGSIIQVITTDGSETCPN